MGTGGQGVKMKKSVRVVVWYVFILAGRCEKNRKRKQQECVILLTIFVNLF